MKGIVSFHPVDPGFFEAAVAPLAAGTAVDLDPYLNEVVTARRTVLTARRYNLALAAILEAARPPKIEPILERPRSAADLFRTSVGLIRSPETVLKGIKTRLDRLDHRLDDLTRLVVRKVEPDIHLLGRPYFIAEANPNGVADAVDRYRDATTAKAVESLAMEQLLALDPALARVEPADEQGGPSDPSYRSEVFREMRALSEIPASVRKGISWALPNGERRSANEALRENMPWIAVWAHARAVPFWMARDVDGLATICLAAGVEPPGCLQTASALFHRVEAAAPGITDGLGRELDRPNTVGAYVAPHHVGDLVVFLMTHGAKIIRVATRAGEGNMASVLLRKIRECAVYAERHKLGYLEASGILPPGVLDADPILEPVRV